MDVFYRRYRPLNVARSVGTLRPLIPWQRRCNPLTRRSSDRTPFRLSWHLGVVYRTRGTWEKLDENGDDPPRSVVRSTVLPCLAPSLL